MGHFWFYNANDSRIYSLLGVWLPFIESLKFSTAAVFSYKGFPNNIDMCLSEPLRPKSIVLKSHMELFTLSGLLLPNSSYPIIYSFLCSLLHLVFGIICKSPGFSDLFVLLLSFLSIQNLKSFVNHISLFENVIYKWFFKNIFGS